MAGVILRENSRQFEIRKIKIEPSEEETSLSDPEMSEVSNSSSPVPPGQEQGTAHNAVVTSRQEGRQNLRLNLYFVSQKNMEAVVLTLI